MTVGLLLCLYLITQNVTSHYSRAKEFLWENCGVSKDILSIGAFDLIVSQKNDS